MVLDYAHEKNTAQNTTELNRTCGKRGRVGVNTASGFVPVTLTQRNTKYYKCPDMCYLIGGSHAIKYSSINRKVLQMKTAIKR